MVTSGTHFLIFFLFSEFLSCSMHLLHMNIISFDVDTVNYLIYLGKNGHHNNGSLLKINGMVHLLRFFISHRVYFFNIDSEHFFVKLIHRYYFLCGLEKLVI